MVHTHWQQRHQLYCVICIYLNAEIRLPNHCAQVNTAVWHRDQGESLWDCSYGWWGLELGVEPALFVKELHTVFVCVKCEFMSSQNIVTTIKLCGVCCLNVWHTSWTTPYIFQPAKEVVMWFMVWLANSMDGVGCAPTGQGMHTIQL